MIVTQLIPYGKLLGSFESATSTVSNNDGRQNTGAKFYYP